MPAPKQPKSTKKRVSKPNVDDKISENASNPYADPFEPKSPRSKPERPKSRLEENGINGPEFSRFIWELVNEENGGNRPEPQVCLEPEICDM